MATSAMSKCISTAKKSRGLTIRRTDTTTNGAEIEYENEIRIYSDRSAGGHCHHRHSRRFVVSSFEQRKKTGATHGLHEQTAANKSGCADVFRRFKRQSAAHS